MLDGHAGVRVAGDAESGDEHDRLLYGLREVMGLIARNGDDYAVGFGRPMRGVWCHRVRASTD